jgi:ADP-heptose:LPS heptosyltransferase
VNRPKVLIARLDSAGDVLLSGPAVRAVAASADVVYLTSPQGRPAAELLPGVQRVVEFNCPWIHADPPPLHREQLQQLEAELSGQDLLAGAILTSSHQSALPLAMVLRLASSARLAAVSHEYAGSLLDVRIPGDPDVHEVERALAVVGALGYELPARDDRALAVTAVSRRRAPGQGRNRPVVIHPGASAPARTWTPERWAELAAALERDGHEVVVTGGPGERNLTAQVAAAGTRVRDLGGATSLGSLARLLASAAVVVTGNTGPMHLSAAVGTPVAVLFAPTVPPERWRPWMVEHRLLGSLDIGCRGCRSRRCPLPDQPCLGVVHVDEVRSAVAELVAAATPPFPVETRVDSVRISHRRDEPSRRVRAVPLGRLNGRPTE